MSLDYQIAMNAVERLIDDGLIKKWFELDDKREEDFKKAKEKIRDDDEPIFSEEELKRDFRKVAFQIEALEQKPTVEQIEHFDLEKSTMSQNGGSAGDDEQEQEYEPLELQRSELRPSPKQSALKKTKKPKKKVTFGTNQLKFYNPNSDWTIGKGLLYSKLIIFSAKKANVTEKNFVGMLCVSEP